MTIFPAIVIIHSAKIQKYSILLKAVDACSKIYELWSRMKYNEQVCAAPKAEKVYL